MTPGDGLEFLGLSSVLRNCLPFELLIDLEWPTGVKYIFQAQGPLFKLNKPLRAVFSVLEPSLHTAQISRVVLATP